MIVSMYVEDSDQPFFSGEAVRHDFPGNPNEYLLEIQPVRLADPVMQAKRTGMKIRIFINADREFGSVIPLNLTEAETSELLRQANKNRRVR